MVIIVEEEELSDSPFDFTIVFVEALEVGAFVTLIFTNTSGGEFSWLSEEKVICFVVFCTEGVGGKCVGRKGGEGSGGGVEGGVEGKHFTKFSGSQLQFSTVL